MQRWEYMTWIVGYGGTSGSTVSNWHGGKVKVRNGVEVPDWKHGPDLAEALNAAGAEAWELVSVFFPVNLPALTSTDPIYIFKRPVA
jgi:hypothetical protein